MLNVKVAVRIRPFSERELIQNDDFVVQKKGNSVVVNAPKVCGKQFMNGRKKSHRFVVDFCFDPREAETSTQEAVYRKIGVEVLDSMFGGYNACVLAYGHSASGKTYTMMGVPEDPGLTPRICQGLFDALNAESSVNFQTSVSFLEIYNEKVRDLLKENEGKETSTWPLRVREHPKLGPYVQDLSQHVITDKTRLLHLLDLGNKRRSTASTENNIWSSRSHAVFTLRFKQTVNETYKTEKFSKVHLVDLAGSEKMNSVQSKVRLKEGANINKSLVTLGNVISALADSHEPAKKRSSTQSWQPFVPYRDSVLTWLLKDSLGGNSNTIMIATVSPASSCFNETVNTLGYAKRTKRIVNRPVINEDPKSRIIRKLREEIIRLKSKLLSQQKRDGNEMSSFDRWPSEGDSSEEHKKQILEFAFDEQRERGASPTLSLDSGDSKWDFGRRSESSRTVECDVRDVTDEKVTGVNRSLVESIHDPQNFSEKLFANLEKVSSATLTNPALFSAPLRGEIGTDVNEKVDAWNVPLKNLTNVERKYRICMKGEGNHHQHFVRKKLNQSKDEQKRSATAKDEFADCKDVSYTGSTQSCTELSNLSQSNSETSLNMSDSMEGSSTPNQWRGTGWSNQRAKPRQLKTNVATKKKIDTVEAVTSRLYAKADGKNGNHSGSPSQRVKSDVKNSPRTAKFKRATMKICEVNKMSLLEAAKKSRSLLVDCNTQTDFVEKTIRVKEQSVITDLQGGIQDVLEGFGPGLNFKNGTSSGLGDSNSSIRNYDSIDFSEESFSDDSLDREWCNEKREEETLMTFGKFLLSNINNEANSSSPKLYGFSMPPSEPKPYNVLGLKSDWKTIALESLMAAEVPGRSNIDDLWPEKRLMSFTRSLDAEESMSAECSYPSSESVNASTWDDTSSEDFVFYDNSADKKELRTGPVIRDRELYTITEHSELSDASEIYGSAERRTSSPITTATKKMGKQPTVESNGIWWSQAETQRECASEKSNKIEGFTPENTAVAERGKPRKQDLLNHSDGPGTGVSLENLFKIEEQLENNRTSGVTSCRRHRYNDLFHLGRMNAVKTSEETGFSSLRFDSTPFGDELKKPENEETLFGSEDSVTLVFVGPTTTRTSILAEIIKRTLERGSTAQGPQTQEEHKRERSKGRETLGRSLSVDTALVALTQIAQQPSRNASFRRALSLDNLVNEEGVSVWNKIGEPMFRDAECQCDLELSRKKRRRKKRKSKLTEKTKQTSPAPLSWESSNANSPAQAEDELDSDKKSCSGSGPRSDNCKQDQRCTCIGSECGTTSSLRHSHGIRRVRFSQPDADGLPQGLNRPQNSIDAMSSFLLETANLLRNFNSFKKETEEDDQKISSERRCLKEMNKSRDECVKRGLQSSCSLWQDERFFHWRWQSNYNKQGGTSQVNRSCSDCDTWKNTRNNFYGRKQTPQSRAQTGLSSSLNTNKAPINLSWNMKNSRPLKSAEWNPSRQSASSWNTEINGKSQYSSSDDIKMSSVEEGKIRGIGTRKRRTTACEEVCTCTSRVCPTTSFKWLRAVRSTIELNTFGPGPNHCVSFCMFCRQNERELYCSSPNLNSECGIGLCRLHYYGHCPCSNAKLVGVPTRPRAYMQHLLSLRRQIVATTVGPP